ncbi:MAG: sulfite exporter TauE/SafE family protein [Candidatus Dormibacteraeota bacterium]|nr:sulfite exporter TauE/SafE family protein [Candidatus Dormibacteraeota bacterium]
MLGGLLGGLLGVGGGFVMIPLLVLWAKVPQHRANGTSLLAIIPIAIVGALVYYFQGGKHQVDLGFALLLMIGSVVGAYLGARAMSRIPEAQLKVVVVLVMVAVGLKELVFP